MSIFETHILILNILLLIIIPIIVKFMFDNPLSIKQIRKDTLDWIIDNENGLQPKRMGDNRKLEKIMYSKYFNRLSTIEQERITIIFITSHNQTNIKGGKYVKK